MTDPNWLLATLAQSSAALVAIVGGFVVARVIALQGAREDLQREVESFEAKIEGLLASRDKTLDDEATEYVHSRIPGWARTLFDLHAGTDERPPDWCAAVVEVVAEKTGDELDERDRRVADAVIRRWDRAQRELTAHWDSSDGSFTLDDLRRDGTVEVPSGQLWIWELVEDELDASVERKRRLDVQQQVQELREMGASLEATMLEMSTAPQFPSIAALQGLGSGVANYQYGDELEHLDREHALVDVHLEATRRQLRELRAPPLIRRAVWALAIMTLLGVVAPVTVMAFEPTSVAWWGRVLLIVAFLGGLANLGRVLLSTVDEIDRSGTSRQAN